MIDKISSVVQTLEELINDEPDFLLGIMGHVERAIDLLRNAAKVFGGEQGREVERTHLRDTLFAVDEGLRGRAWRTRKTRSKSLAGKIRSYARSFADNDFNRDLIIFAAGELEKVVLRYAYHQADSVRKGGALKKSTRLYWLAVRIRYKVKEISERTAALTKKLEVVRSSSGVQDQGGPVEIVLQESDDNSQEAVEIAAQDSDDSSQEAVDIAAQDSDDNSHEAVEGIIQFSDGEIVSSNWQDDVDDNIQEAVDIAAQDSDDNSQEAVEIVVQESDDNSQEAVEDIIQFSDVEIVSSNWQDDVDDNIQEAVEDIIQFSEGETESNDFSHDDVDDNIVECGEDEFVLFALEGVPSTSAHQDDNEIIKDSRVPSTSYDDDVVGFGKNIKELVMHLTEEDNSHPITHICGQSGLGKTTLARKIYHHAKIRTHFECFAWANIDGNMKDGVRGIWEGLLIELASPTTMEKKQITEMRDDEIAKTLLYTLNHKICLVILDLGFSMLESLDKSSLWTRLDDSSLSKTWNRLKTAFPEDRTHSRVLIITPMTTERNFIRFELHSLDEIESWELLKKKVDFGKIVANREVETKMRQLAQEMVRYCDGLPFAILLLSGLLSTSYEVSEWEKLHKDIKRDRSRKRTMDRNREDQMLDISLNVLLNLSYEKLPYHLKQCFLHLSHYPEKFDIRAKELCLIWMAEGFTSLSPGVKVGEYECLSRLVKRYMVEVREWGSTGRIKTCYIHDFMREFCWRKTGSTDFIDIVNLERTRERKTRSTDFIDMVNLERTRESLNRGFSMLTNRRLAVHMSTDIVDKLTSSINDADTRDYFLRSFICFNRVPYPDYEKVMKPLFNRYRMLRVLKFENLTCGYVGKLPKEIEKLRLLRFLSLKNSYVEHLPSSIGNLRSLQTLDLRTNWSVEFPNVMWKLKRLKHLYLPHRSSVKGNKLRLDTLSSLQTLVNISTEYSDLKDLMILKNLQKLKVLVNNDANLRKIFENSFDHLQSLAVEISVESEADCIPFMSKFHHICKLHIEGKISKLPEDYQNLLPNLQKLTLKRTCLNNDPMVTLEKLENLRILLLDYDSFNGANMVCSTGGFPRLESLSLVGLEKLKEWKVEEGALESLRSLQIEYCYRLKTIPDGLRYVLTLKAMVIRRMPRYFKMMLEEEGNKTYNIPNLTVTELLD